MRGWWHVVARVVVFLLLPLFGHSVSTDVIQTICALQNARLPALHSFQISAYQWLASSHFRMNVTCWLFVKKHAIFSMVLKPLPVELNSLKSLNKTPQSMTFTTYTWENRNWWCRRRKFIVCLKMRSVALKLTFDCKHDIFSVQIIFIRIFLGFNFLAILMPLTVFTFFGTHFSFSSFGLPMKVNHEIKAQHRVQFACLSSYTRFLVIVYHSLSQRSLSVWQWLRSSC